MKPLTRKDVANRVLELESNGKLDKGKSRAEYLEFLQHYESQPHKLASAPFCLQAVATIRQVQIIVIDAHGIEVYDANGSFPTTFPVSEDEKRDDLLEAYKQGSVVIYNDASRAHYERCVPSPEGRLLVKLNGGKYNVGFWAGSVLAVSSDTWHAGASFGADDAEATSWGKYDATTGTYTSPPGFVRLHIQLKESKSDRTPSNLLYERVRSGDQQQRQMKRVDGAKQFDGIKSKDDRAHLLDPLRSPEADLLLAEISAAAHAVSPSSWQPIHNSSNPKDKSRRQVTLPEPMHVNVKTLLKMHVNALQSGRDINNSGALAMLTHIQSALEQDQAKSVLIGSDRGGLQQEFHCDETPFAIIPLLPPQAEPACKASEPACNEQGPDCNKQEPDRNRAPQQRQTARQQRLTATSKSLTAASKSLTAAGQGGEALVAQVQELLMLKAMFPSIQDVQTVAVDVKVDWRRKARKRLASEVAVAVVAKRHKRILDMLQLGGS